MKQATLYGIKDIRIEDVPAPEPGPGEALVRVKAVGVCGSDVHYYLEGRIGDQVVTEPMPVGHEFMGVVEDTGADYEGPPKGARVAIEPGVSCGECDNCRNGRPNLCPNVIFYGTPPVHGSFREYVTHPGGLLFPLPDEVSDAAGALLEPLGIALYAVWRVGVELGDVVVVLGSGPIGLLTAACAKAAGASRTIMTDILPYRMEFAKTYVADEVLDGNDDVPGRVAGLTGGKGAGVVFECAGKPETVVQCATTAGIGGRVGLVGIPEEDEVPLPIHHCRRRELTLQNVRRSRFTGPPGIELVARGRIDLDALATHSFPLEKTADALQLAADYADGVIKAVVTV
jgi:L-iditol 2-dehydrogenase